MSEAVIAGQATAEREPRLADRAVPGRLLSLDVFRGITIAGMIMVNNPGSGTKFAPLGHAEWHGWTPTDLVFPSFLFIVGVAMTFSFDKRLSHGFSRLRLFEHVVRRTLILFCLGLIMFSFPVWRLMAPYVLLIAALGCLFRDEPPLGWPRDATARLCKTAGWTLLIAAVGWWILDFQYFQMPHPIAVDKLVVLRVPGVLQRIAVCYLLASIIMFFLGVRGRVVATLVILLGYWWMVEHTWAVTPPAGYPMDARPEGVLHAWLDARLLGRHFYSELPDPEGILSTVGGLATCLVGILTGTWLRGRRSENEKLIGLFFAANVLIFTGLWMSYGVPINKKIWTSSYVLLAGGIAMHVLAMCYWLIDVKGYKRWAMPFVVFGTNAILVFFASGIVARVLAFYRYQLEFPFPDRAATSGDSMRTWLWEHLFQRTFPATGWGPYNASLAFALIYVVIWLILLIPLYRRRIFLKV